MSTQPKFNRHDSTQPLFLARLRAPGGSRQHRLLGDYTHGRNESPRLHHRHPVLFADHMSVAHRELYNLPKPRYNPAGKVFLDAGCGNSPDALIARLSGHSVAHKVDLFAPTYNADFKGMMRFGWQPLKFTREERRQGVVFTKGDICEPLFFGAGSIDTIVCSAVLDLMTPDDRLLFYQQAHRLLKSGGLLSVSILRLANGYGFERYEDRRALQFGFKEIRRTPKRSLNVSTDTTRTLTFVLEKI